MRMKFIYLLFSFFIGSHLDAQIGGSDTIPTQNPFGQIIIHPVTHATFVLFTNNSTIYVDPTGGANAFSGMKDPDMIIVTDIHGDHFDSKTIDAVKGTNTIIVVPKAVADKMENPNNRQLVVLNNGDTKNISGISVMAIPMYNLPEAADSRHPKGRGNGYVLTIGDKKIYISGDTEDIPEMRNLQGIDIAFICMNLPYTMDVYQAASAVLAFKPKIVYPYHYRGENGLSDVNKFKKIITSSNAKIDVRIREWYPGH
ncbi:MAG: MBL fold metallo-hydrolase [Flavitalea sp.]